MKLYSIFQQYIWLINIIQQHGRLTLDEINRYWIKNELSKGIPMPRTTFNRHRDAILDMLGIIIDCERKGGYKYYIANEHVLHDDSIQKWLLTTMSVNNMLAENLAIHNRILIESIPSDGALLHRFIEAMKRSVLVVVRYQRYGDAGVSTRLLAPYFVKLSNKRWYAVVRHSVPAGLLFTLAFDRMLSLELTEEKFECEKDFDPAKWMKDCYGVVNDIDVPIEKVVIRAFGREACYMRDLPLHHSQHVKEITQDYADYELTLRPTADFITPLLARGCAIKVLQPQWLAEEIKHQHIQAAKRYDE